MKILAFCLLLLYGSCCFAKVRPSTFCSFDNGFCGYLNDESGTDDFDWIRLKNAGEKVTRFRIISSSRFQGGFGFGFYEITKKVSYQVVLRGPTTDTTGKGFFMYTKPRQDSAKADNLARLVSPVYKNVSCVKFYYFMYGNDIGGLEVLVKIEKNAPTKVWSLSGNQANAWKVATIPVKTNGSQTVQIYFNAVVGTKNKASVAIDDVNIMTDQCSFSPTTAKPKEVITEGNGSCTFDDSLCSYKNMSDDDFDWQRINSESLTSTFGPRKDHTTGLGKYMQAEGPTRGSKARLVSPPLYNISCVTFYYYMFGSQIGTLNVYVKVQGNYTRLQQISGNQGNRWYKSQLGLGGSGSALKGAFKVVFEAVNGGRFAGGIAIDDISAFSVSCPPQTSNPSPSSGPTIMTTQIPEGSVRLLNGQTSYDGRVEVFHNGVWGTVCDDLWDLADGNVVCKMLGFPGAVRITKSQVYGRGVGTIWLDDVNCKGNEASIAQCGHGGWGNNNCDHYEDAGVVCQLDYKRTSTKNGECSFEYDTCGYKNGDRTNSEFDWKRWRGPTTSSGTGPRNDQSGKGYYVYTEASNEDTGARAKLISPVLPANTKCISFYYHMMGRNIGWLNVYSKRETSQSIVKIWTLSGEQGNSWIQGQVPINATGNGALKVIFEGVRGNSEIGDIAIDTITVSNKSCNMTPSTATSQPKINVLEGDVRLVDGPNLLQGRVEVFHHGQWGTICNNMWSDEDATVVCKMLGYSGLGRAITSSNITQGVVPIWLDKVQCTGGESNLLQCNKNPWGRHRCYHYKDSWALCSNGGFGDECKRYKVLNNGDRAKTFAGQEDQCDRNSDIFPGQWHRFTGPAGDRMPSSCVPEGKCSTKAPGWLNGDHPMVEEGKVTRKVCFNFHGDCCKWSTFIQVKNCSGFYVYELQKPPSCNLRYCGNGPDTMMIRLVGGSNDYSGRVEVYHKDSWGTICHDHWDLNDAKVVCRMLGYLGALQAHPRAKFGLGFGPHVWMDDVSCNGEEKELSLCKHAGWDNDNCNHYHDAGVTCLSDKEYSCDFENDLCLFKSTTGGNKELTWTRRQASSNSSAHYYQPKYDHTFGEGKKPMCLEGWTSKVYKGYCYKFATEDNIPWQQAVKKCQTENAWLADIQDHDEMRFIRDHIFPSGVSQVFIGLQDKNGNGNWTHLDGKVVNLKDIWPNLKMSDDGQEYCAAMTADGASFNDVRCDRSYSMISYLCKAKYQRKGLGYYLQMQPGTDQLQPLARLVSPVFPTTFACLSFYYQAVGKHVDSIRVVLRPGSRMDMHTYVWELQGNQSNDKTNQSRKWSKAQIPIKIVNATQFSFEIQAARLGLSTLDVDIAIDDIKINTSIGSENCGFYPPNARPRNWAIEASGSCSFTNGTCDYFSEKTDMDYTDWLKYDLANPSTSSILGNKGPYDHTTYSFNSGSYMFMQHSIGQTSGKSARLVSPLLKPTQANCLSFYFFFIRKMVSSDIDLTIFIRHAQNFVETPVWEIASRDLKAIGYWNRAVLPLKQKHNFQVIFEGIINGNGGIGLDDILISSSAECTLEPSHASPPTYETNRVIRLASSAINGTGRVEVYHRGRWGTVCGNIWTLSNAHVVCRQLGYDGALAALCCGLYGGGTGRVWLSDVSCSGKEASLETCPHKGWGNNKCLHNQDATVVCNSHTSKEVQLRLNGTSDTYRGRVEVLYAGILGTIDATGWDIFDATAVCRQLGFAGAATAFTGSVFGRGEGPIWLSDVKCNGNETKLSQCILKRSSGKIVTVTSGKHINDAGVECFGARLFGGNRLNEGRAQIQYKGKWGSICGRGWNMNAAHVICRNLGYQRARSTSLVAKGSDAVLLDEVKCQGDEASIMFCLHRGLNFHRCDSSKVVIVDCEEGKDQQVSSPCQLRPCKNDGKCAETKDNFMCVCPRNFTDETCQTYIGDSIVGVLLKGDIDQWQPLLFKVSLAAILNEHCTDCNKNSFRSKRESDISTSSNFTSDDIIIVEDPSTRSPPGFLYVEFAVVKKINGKLHVFDSKRLQDAIDKARKEGIGGFDVIADESMQYTNKISHNLTIFMHPEITTNKKASGRSSGIFKTAFAVVLVLMLASLTVIAVMIIFLRKKKKNPPSNDYQLKILNKTAKRDCETLLNEEDSQPF